METALRFNTIVLPGNRIEVTSPELSEGTAVELVVTDRSTANYRRYPSVVEAEYETLVDRELHGTLNEEEACRLHDICNIIAEIDRITLPNDIRTHRLNQIETELNNLRAEIEALPDA